MFKRISLMMLLVVFGSMWAISSPVIAAEISVHDVYQAAESGHLQQAQAMMQQVLRDHPESAKAHYVEAELFAKSGQLDYARRELKTAQRLDPTLGFAKPAALEALEARLNGSADATRSSAAIPWGYVLLGVGLLLVLIMLIRARAQRNNVMPAVIPGNAPPYGGYGPSYGSGYGPAPTGGMGSGIMGGLATGAALGAGMVAGEALASHFIDGEHHERHVDESQPLAQKDWAQNDWDDNANLGGDDFGVNDSSSWGDSGGSDMGGDWS